MAKRAGREAGPQTQKGHRRLHDVLQRGSKRPCLSIYTCAGYPSKLPLEEQIRLLDMAGVDFLEVGMPYSDPMADGPVVQDASSKALAAGMRLDKLFDAVANARKRCAIPLVWMGYWNAVLQFGPERFARRAKEVGFEAFIVPDLPPELYALRYESMFREHGLKPVFLVTPQSTEARIRALDAMELAFLYAVASASVTGSNGGVSAESSAYLSRLKGMQLRHPVVVGFGIHDRHSFQAATADADGAIVGSAFLKAMGQAKDPASAIAPFVSALRP